MDVTFTYLEYVNAGMRPPNLNTGKKGITIQSLKYKC